MNKDTYLLEYVNLLQGQNPMDRYENSSLHNTAGAISNGTENVHVFGGTAVGLLALDRLVRPSSPLMEAMLVDVILTKRSTQQIYRSTIRYLQGRNNSTYRSQQVLSSQM